MSISRRVVQEKYSLRAFNGTLRCEADCAKLLFALRWSNGFKCVRCGSVRGTVIRSRSDGSVRCKQCNIQTSLKQGTRMEGSQVPLLSWLCGFHILLTCDPDITTLEFKHAVRSISYDTAMSIRYQIEKMIADSKYADLCKFLKRPKRSNFERLVQYNDELIPIEKWVRRVVKNPKPSEPAPYVPEENRPDAKLTPAAFKLYLIRAHQRIYGSDTLTASRAVVAGWTEPLALATAS